MVSQQRRHFVPKPAGTVVMLASPEGGCTVDLLFVQEFDVYFAQSNAALYEKISTGDTAWCGIERLVSGHRHKCSISTTPFQTTFIGVVPSPGRDLLTTGTPHRTILHYVLCSSCDVYLRLSATQPMQHFQAACQVAHSSCMLL